MFVSMVDIYRSEKFVFPFARLLAYCLSYAPLIVGAVLTYRAIQSEYIAIIAVAMLTVAYAAVNESFVMKNKVADQFVSVIRRRINGR
jgi:positive regulator of sigma E activity